MSKQGTAGTNAHYEITKTGISAGSDAKAVIEAIATATKAIIDEISHLHSTVAEGCPPK